MSDRRPAQSNQASEASCTSRSVANGQNGPFCARSGAIKTVCGRGLAPTTVVLCEEAQRTTDRCSVPCRKAILAWHVEQTARYRSRMPGRPQPAGFDLPGLLYLVCVLAVLFIPALLGRRGSPPGPSDTGSDDGGGSRPRQPPAPP